MKLIATIEAKAFYKDVSAVIDCRCKDYARNIRDEDKAYRLGEWNGFKVPFIFATNGRPYNRQLETNSGIWFLDLRRADNVPKALRGYQIKAVQATYALMPRNLKAITQSQVSTCDTLTTIASLCYSSFTFTYRHNDGGFSLEICLCQGFHS